MFYSKRKILIQAIFDNVYSLKMVLVLAVFLFGAASLSTSFVVAKAEQIAEMSVQKEDIEITDMNSKLKIFGSTRENGIKLSNCHMDKLLLENININVPSKKAVQICKGLNIAVNTTGKCEIEGRLALTLVDSKIHFGDNSAIKFTGGLSCDKKSQLSFAPTSEVIFISKQSATSLQMRNIDCGSGKSGFLINKIPNRNEIAADIEVQLISEDKSVQRKLMLKRDEVWFGLSLPKNKYTVSYDIKSGNEDKIAFENQLINITDKVCSNTAKKMETKPLQIVGLSLINPSEYGVSDGKIEFSAVGGSGKYKYFCKEIASDKGIFTDLSYGDYTIGVVDSNNSRVSQMVRLKQPLSTKLDYIMLGKIKLRKNLNGDFEITLDEADKAIEFKAQPCDERASVVLNGGEKIVLNKYGVIKIPVEVTAGELKEKSAIIIKRKPPYPKIHNVPKGWINGECLLSISQNEDSMDSYISIDGGSYNKSSSIKISKSGIHAVSAYYEADKIKSDEVKNYIKIDNEKPKIDEIVIERLYAKGKEGKISSKDTSPQFVCKIYASDAHSGIASVKVELENGKTEQAYFSDGVYTLPLGEEYKGKISVTAVDKCGNVGETYFKGAVNCDSQNPKIINTIFPIQTNSDRAIEIVFDEDISENLGKLYYNVNKGASMLISNEEVKAQKNTIIINIPLQGGKYKLFIPKESILDIAGNCMADDECYCFEVKSSVKASKSKKYKPNTTPNFLPNVDDISKIIATDSFMGVGNSQTVTMRAMDDELFKTQDFPNEFSANEDISTEKNEENILSNIEKTIFLAPKTQTLVTVISFPSTMFSFYNGLVVINYFSEILYL